MTTLGAATAYTQLGWSVIPIPHRSKNPGKPGWTQMQLKVGDLPLHFNGRPQNIGVLLGEPSGWIVDVDLDHARCVELAPKYLPETPAKFGRAGKLKSHWVYRVTAPMLTKKYKSKSVGMLVEARSTGAQTVFPPSTHTSGEVIEWDGLGGWAVPEPAAIEPDVLLTAVHALADAVHVELGESNEPQSRSNKAKAEGGAKQPTETSLPTDRIRGCVAAMLRMNMRDNNDGSGRLFAAACRAVERDLNETEAVAAIREYARQRPFPKEWSDEQIVQRLRDAERKVERVVSRTDTEEGRRRVVITTDEHRVVSETIEALAADETIFHRGGALVRVLREPMVTAGSIDRSAGNATISFLPQASLRERMTLYAQFKIRVERKGALEEVATHPTQWLVAAVDARGEWPGIRLLKGISDVPILRADGSLCQTPGYDAQTRVLYEPTDQFPEVSDDVTLDDADAAVAELLDVVCDFRFEGDDHRAAWLASVLTPLARFAFEGPAPLFLIDANVRGAGKSLLVQSAAHILLGREMPVSSYAHCADEMRKKITAIALAGDRMIHLDNLEGSFGNDALDRALTATRWKDRILGRSQEVDLPSIPVWYATGNNVAVAADTMRRVVHVRLDVLDERPEERTGFKHPELLSWIDRERPRLLTCALTILRAYCGAGMPRQQLSAFGSFEGWSRLVREAVVWAGQPDPCATRARLAEQSDVTADALGQLLMAWQGYDVQRQGLVVADLLQQLYGTGGVGTAKDAAVAMRGALENLVGCPPGKPPTPRHVGAKLRRYRRRTVGGLYLDTNHAESKRSGALWRLHNA